ncbi:2-amino-4-hydroxy-6-hydroxymethyldihydropteridine diphosphokinase [Halalkalibacillus halophilus]|uniref:2-amino-4-hydroxy-6- hydroxymethyldihydropteridine diphosphokinase n=1 Tax=Halalkalibacillus halophilus TaxID=392827 RepID=UPI0004238F10|nr:2-amino-4-hydroxy-6-hydroxymethyldihydropteridine diphosphokinase [Halalkalibacillus halophilus]
MINVYIALGSNIEPKDTYLDQAIQQLDDHEQIEVHQQSSKYRTKPVGYTEQDLFLNMVVLIKTSLSPEALLTYTQSIENTLGRERHIRFGPRTIDLDILLFGDKEIQSEMLTVPHPRMTERAFVLIPLNEINDSIAINNTSLQTHIEQLDKEDLEGIEKI